MTLIKVKAIKSSYETCSEDNDVQLITPQTASASDSDAVDLILEDLENSETSQIHSSQIPSMAPMKIIKHANIVLHSPVSGKAPKRS